MFKLTATYTNLYGIPKTVYINGLNIQTWTGQTNQMETTGVCSMAGEFESEAARTHWIEQAKRHYSDWREL